MAIGAGEGNVGHPQGGVKKLTTGVGAGRPPFNEGELADFIEGYLDCWLTFDQPPPADVSQEEEWSEGESYGDAGFGVSDLTDESLEVVRRHCRRFLIEAWPFIEGRDCYEGSVLSQLGYDFAGHSQRLGVGFDRDEWPGRSRKLLGKMANDHGALWIEPHKGMIHIRDNNDDSTPSEVGDMVEHITSLEPRGSAEMGAPDEPDSRSDLLPT